MAVRINKWKIDPYSIRENLQLLPTCVILQVEVETTMKQFMIDHFGEYTKGLSFYQLLKSEKVQAGKVFAIRERSSGDVFSGLNTRAWLEIPDGEVTVEPPYHYNYEVYIQSTSPVRKLRPRMQVLVLQ